MIIDKKWFYLGLPFSTGALIALFSPLNVLDYGWANFIYELASAVIPSVRQIKGNYELGEVAKVYYSFVWLMSPLIFLGTYLELTKNKESMFEKWRNNNTSLKIFLIFAMGIFFPFCIFLALSFTFENGNLDDMRNYWAFHSRFGMPWWGFIIPTGAAGLTAIVVFWVRNFFRMFD